MTSQEDKRRERGFNLDEQPKHTIHKNVHFSRAVLLSEMFLDHSGCPVACEAVAGEALGNQAMPASPGA